MDARTAHSKVSATRRRRRSPKSKAAPLAQPSSDDFVVVPIGSLRASRNARTHGPAQIEKIVASLKEFGWMNPPLVDGKGRILAGHGRWEAAKAMGLTEIPVLRRAHLTPRQKRAYVLADNRLAELAGWDPALLAVELGSLGKLGFDLGILGWDPDEAREVIATAAARLKGATGPDDAPPLPQTPTSRAGDLWSLGQHRILCGDATQKDAVVRLLHGRRTPVLMVTDPPYGVEYDATWRARAGLADIEHLATGAVTNDDRVDWSEAYGHFPGDIVYVWHAGTKAHLVAESLEQIGFRIRAQIIWVKSRFVISRGAYHGQHEPVFYATRDGADDHWQEDRELDGAEGLDVFQRFEAASHENLLYAVRHGATAHYRGGRKQSTVWNIEHLKSDTGHSTQKPIEAMKRPMENNSAAGDAVYDPFAGSGTTIIAAEMTGRICYAVELEPGYVDVCIKRWQAFTRHTAVLESTSQSWSEVEEERTHGQPASP